MYCKNDHQQIESKFLNIQDAETAYVLGLLWADGNVEYNEKTYRHRISLEVKKDDFDIFIVILNKLGSWRTQFRVKQPTVKNKNSSSMGTARITSKNIVKFLMEHNYKSKSDSPCSILKLIPEEFKHYFFRGVCDGDGCFYFCGKKSGNFLTVSSCYEQDWKYLEDLCNSLNVRFRIQKRTEIYGNSSAFIVNRKADLLKIGDYIYQNYENDRIGLKRKYDKFLEIKTIVNNS